MGLKKVIQDVGKSASDSFLGTLGDFGGAAVDSVMGTLNSALWNEYFESGDMSGGVLMKRGKKITNGKNRNKADDNIISSGSGIDVQVGQCMIIVENGKIVEFCAEPGRYTYDHSSQPSFFSGENKGLQAVGEEMLRQFKFGGVRSSTQRVYFINMCELIDKPIKWGFGDIPFHHTTLMRNGAPPIELDITLMGNGEVTIKIANPIKFFENIGAQKIGDDNDGLITLNDEEIMSNLKSGIVDNIFEAIQNIGFEEAIPFSAIKSGTRAQMISDSINKGLNDEWAGLRGFEVCTFNVNTIAPIQEDKERIQEMQTSFTMGANINAANYDIQKTMAQGIKEAGKNGGANGIMGMAFAMNQMGGTGMGNMQNIPNQAAPVNYNQNPYTQANQPAHAAVVATGASWTCTCGTTNTGKFCSNCGEKNKTAEKKSWTCSCGTVNTGKFCSNCGNKAVKKLKCDKCGWTTEDNTTNYKFCPECGDTITELDFE